ncbi:WD40 repeat containing protein [Babesia gibsoni]|uniref:WD40 repeat containing protein n=1 Tax=Babesia gibsoni TaxID=33632 RepID=A0AAD8PED1_BABGI|nr:WD40 repeat containing protein [Babesia gibsoni]
MPSSVKALTTALQEARRFSSYASDTFRAVPKRGLFISQHEDRLYAFNRVSNEVTDDILLRESFGHDEGKQIARDTFLSLSGADHTAVCLLDADDENVYNEQRISGRCIYRAGGIASYGVSSCGNILAVAFCSGMLTFYNIIAEEGTVYLISTREIKINCKNVTNVCFDASDANTACGTVDGAVVVYKDGTLLKNFHHQKGAISVLRFHPRNPLLLAASQQGDIVMYCLQSKAPIATFQDHLSYVNDIAFLITDDDSAGGFVSCSRDSNVCFWSLSMKTGEVKKAVAEGHVLVKKPFKRLMQFEAVKNVSIVTDGLNNKGTGPWVLFVATESGMLKYIDPLTEKTILERRVAYGQGDEVKCLYLCKTTNEIVVLGSSGTLCFYSINLELRQQYLTNIDGAFQFQLYPDSIPSYMKDNDPNNEDDYSHMDVDGTSANKGAASQQHSDKSTALKFTGMLKGLTSLNSFGGESSKDCRSVSSKKRSDSYMDACRSDWVFSTNWLHRQLTNGIPLVFILCGDDAIRLMALDGRGSYIAFGVAHESHRHTDTVLSISYSYSVKLLASGAKDERVLIWNMRTLCVVAVIPLDGLNVACVSWQCGVGEDATHIRMLASGDNVLKSFDIPKSYANESFNTCSFDDVIEREPAHITTATATATAVKHKKPINAIAFSPNNKLVASVGSDKIVVIYAAVNLIVKGECIGHRRSVVSVAFTRINKTVVSSSVDMTIKIWNLNDFTCIKTLQGHTKAVMKVVVVPNDLQLLSVGMDGLMKVWNIKTSDCVFTADNHSDKVWSAEISGGNILTISGNGVMIWWDDVSAEIEAKKMFEERDEELKRTQVESLALDGKYSEALCLSMELRKPLMASKILQRRCSTQLFRIEKDNKLDYDIFNAWVSHMKTLPDLKKMLTIAFDFIHLWISRNSTSWMANCLLSELIKQFNPAELFLVEGMANRIDSLLAHQSSHITRFINLSEKSHLLDIIVGFKASDSEKVKNSTFSHEVLYK